MLSKPYIIITLALGVICCENPLGSNQFVDPAFNPGLDDPSEEDEQQERLVPHGTGNPSISLTSGVVTRLETAILSITCGETVAYHLGTSSDMPDPADESWVICPSNTFDVTVALSGGYNIFYVWFRYPDDSIFEPVFSFEVTRAFFLQFPDPDPTASGLFGGTQGVVRLSNGYYVVPAPGNDRNGASSGAVHLYNPSGTYVSSVYGESAGDQLGSEIMALPNGNFVASSASYDDSGVTDSGAAILVNGSTGVEINRIAGIVASDGLKVYTDPFLINIQNGNFIVYSSTADVGGISNSGTVILVSGSSGNEIGRVSGATASDGLSSGGVEVLSNNNYVVCSPNDTEGGNASAGSAILVSGSTGTEIGRISGDEASDNFGSGCMTELSNGNYLVMNPAAQEAAVASAGSAVLVNGSTGLEIGRIAGDDANDMLSDGGSVALTNGNIAVVCVSDEVGGNASAGSVRLVNGSTGAQINQLTGSEAAEGFGGGGVVALTNGNYAIGSEITDNGGINAAGAGILVNGSTGVEIGRVSGDAANDGLGEAMLALTNGNFVVMGDDDDVGGVSNAGSAVLVNGSTGAEIGRISGATANDSVGTFAIALTNGNFIVPANNYDVSGVSDAGAIILVNGTTGAEISRIVGDQTSDECGNALALEGGNFLWACILDDDNGSDTGQIGLADGSTGEVISRLRGDDANDQIGQGPPVANDDGNAGWAHSLDDVDGVSDAGSAYLILNN